MSSTLRKISSIFNLKDSRKTEIGAKDITAGLEFISTWLEDRRPGQVFNIVVSGGTVSVLLFKNRKKTKDVDIFSPDADVLREVLEAGRRYNRENDDMPPMWINAEIVAYINGLRGSDSLLPNSIAQDVVLFESPSLVMYAADWRYQLVGKMQRAFDYNDKKDISDAVEILHQLVSQTGKQQRLSEIQTWYEYGIMLKTEHMEFINKAYHTRYGTDGIAA
ncbi:hypothetical protein B0H15DRAFT_1017842 [Mycena belliarum]|uniref:DUF7582 domain-containing protein n=1 Tax=Mycena belliarum TaxID=1033014 RepID=A0AAD6UFI8_9AGAR|nr:hypothetical protein B0H15DRAFT_1017842 [Mycena belliae]